MRVMAGLLRVREESEESEARVSSEEDLGGALEEYNEESSELEAPRKVPGLNIGGGGGGGLDDKKRDPFGLLESDEKEGMMKSRVYKEDVRRLEDIEEALKEVVRSGGDSKEEIRRLEGI